MTNARRRGRETVSLTHFIIALDETINNDKVDLTRDKVRKQRKRRERRGRRKEVQDKREVEGEMNI